MNNFPILVGKPKAGRPQKPLSEILDDDTIFRFAYLPFVIAEVVWDYTGTIIDIAIQMRLQETKKTCREIRELRNHYNQIRARFIDSSHRESENVNMLLFQDMLSHEFSILYHDLCDELQRQYPQLKEDRKTLISSAYMANIVIDALINYTNQQREKVAHITGYTIGAVLPKQITNLRKLLPAFAGEFVLDLNNEFSNTCYSFVDLLLREINSIQFSKV